MTDDLKELLEKLIKAKKNQGGEIDETQLNKIVEVKLYEAINNPKYLHQIMSTISAKQKTTEFPKWEELKKNMGVNLNDNDLIVTAKESDIIDDVLVRNNVYLYGRAGTGKTYTAKKIALLLKRAGYFDEDQEPYYVINCSQWTSPLDILGGFGTTAYRQGTAVLAWQNGGILILDELPKLDPNTAGLLNEILSETATKKPTFIRDGKGDVIPKNSKFHVIATGNTNLKDADLGYGGNNKQDYSLYDRFAGSFWEIGYDTAKELSLNYTAVFSLCVGIREFLNTKPNLIENISIRTMLNFSRTYELQMIRELGSASAPSPFGSTEGSDSFGGKTLRMSIDSFINDLPSSVKEEIRDSIIPKYAPLFSGLTLERAMDECENNTNFQIVFLQDYERIYEKKFK